jgi:hypothetical protein
MFRGLTIPQTVEKVVEALQEYQRLGRKCQGLFVDGGGLGAGVVDMLRALGWNVIDCQGGRASTSPHYRFHAHELWGRMRDAMEKLVLPQEDDLQRQLTQREYGFVGDSHKIMLESKRDMEKRGIMSPDIADALALTFGPSPMEDVYSLEGMGWSNKQVSTYDYDPLERM